MYTHPLDFHFDAYPALDLLTSAGPRLRAVLIAAVDKALAERGESADHVSDISWCGADDGSYYEADVTMLGGGAIDFDVTSTFGTRHYTGALGFERAQKLWSAAQDLSRKAERESDRYLRGVARRKLEGLQQDWPSLAA